MCKPEHRLAAERGGRRYPRDRNDFEATRIAHVSVLLGSALSLNPTQKRKRGRASIPSP
jgi:hypothetical protein